MKEIWKIMNIHDGNYAISNHGRIKRIKAHPKSWDKSYVGKILKLGTAKGGRISVALSQSIDKVKMGKSYLVHILVAKYFIGPRPHGFHVNHKDGNHKNNRVDNLEYISPDDHYKHTRKNRLYAKGNSFPFTKITPKIVNEIRSIGWKPDHKKPSLKDIAKIYNLSETHVHEIIVRKSWKHI